MLTLLTTLACVLYLAPLIVLVLALRRRHWTSIDLASAIAVVFASDFLGTFLLTRLFQVDTAAFVRTGLYVPVVGGRAAVAALAPSGKPAAGHAVPASRGAICSRSARRA